MKEDKNQKRKSTNSRFVQDDGHNNGSRIQGSAKAKGNVKRITIHVQLQQSPPVMHPVPLSAISLMNKESNFLKNENILSSCQLQGTTFFHTEPVHHIALLPLPFSFLSYLL